MKKANKRSKKTDDDPDANIWEELVELEREFGALMGDLPPKEEVAKTRKRRLRRISRRSGSRSSFPSHG